MWAKLFNWGENSPHAPWLRGCAMVSIGIKANCYMLSCVFQVPAKAGTYAGATAYSIFLVLRQGL